MLKVFTETKFEWSRILFAYKYGLLKRPGVYQCFPLGIVRPLCELKWFLRLVRLLQRSQRSQLRKDKDNNKECKLQVMYRCVKKVGIMQVTSQLRKYDETHKIIANRICSERITDELSGKDKIILGMRTWRTCLLRQEYRPTEVSCNISSTVL